MNIKNNNKKKLMTLILTEKQKKFMIKLYSNNVKISRQTRDIIHGYIMSDGYVKPLGNLTVQQCLEQRKFVEWLYSELKPLCVTKPDDSAISIVKNFSKKTQTEYISARFNTRNLLKGFRKMWYQPYITEDGSTGFKKKLPKSLHCFFNPTFVTVWFAGDGTIIKGSVGAKIEVTNYEPHERERLKKLFKNKFDINTVINKAGYTEKKKQQWTININSAEYPKFRTLITQMDLIEKVFPNKLHPR